MKNFKQRRQVARTLLNRKHGATVDVLAKRLGTDERKVRSLIDNLRRSGEHVENVAPHRFRLVSVTA